ncbi:hypothetical protein LXL04_010733 [Taraxacum kok-saghyz]
MFKKVRSITFNFFNLLIGAIKNTPIKKAEEFKQAMKNIVLKTPPSGIGTTLQECLQITKTIDEFPLIIRPAFTLGGSGGGIAYNKQEFETICKSGLAASITSQVIVEKSLLGWKQYETKIEMLKTEFEQPTDGDEGRRLN